jgi:hypothetical protein
MDTGRTFLKIVRSALVAAAIAGATLVFPGCPQSTGSDTPAYVAPATVKEVSWSEFMSDTSNFASIPSSYAGLPIIIKASDATATDVWSFIDGSAAAAALSSRIDTSALRVTFSESTGETLHPEWPEKFFLYGTILNIVPKDTNKHVLISTGAAGSTTHAFDMNDLHGRMSSNSITLASGAVMTVPAGDEVVLDVNDAAQKLFPVPATKLEYLLSHRMFAGIDAKVGNISISGNVRRLVDDLSLLSRDTDLTAVNPADRIHFDGDSAMLDGVGTGSPYIVELTHLNDLMWRATGGRGLALSNLHVEHTGAPGYLPNAVRFGRKYDNVTLNVLNLYDTGAGVSAVSFANAEFDNFVVNSCDVRAADFSSSKGSVEFSGTTQMWTADLSHSDLSGRVGAACTASGMKAEDAKLGMEFDTATVGDINLRGATLKAGTKFRDGTDFTNAIFTFVSLDGMLELKGCTLPVEMEDLTAPGDPGKNGKAGLALYSCSVGSNGVNATKLGRGRFRDLEVYGSLTGTQYIESTGGMGTIHNFRGPSSVYNSLVPLKYFPATGQKMFTLAALGNKVSTFLALLTGNQRTIG